MSEDISGSEEPAEDSDAEHDSANEDEDASGETDEENASGLGRVDAIMQASLRLKKEFEEMQAEVLLMSGATSLQAALLPAPEERSDEVQKGRHAHAQLQLWDSLLELRIRLQVSLSSRPRAHGSAALPPQTAFHSRQTHINILQA